MIHAKTDSVGDILNPVNGYRGSLARKGITPKDHHRENIRAMKEKERENREKRERPDEKNVFKLSQFQNVGSTLSSYLKNVSQQDVPEKNKHFLKSGAGDSRRHDREREVQQEVHKEDDVEENIVPAPKPAVPKKNDVGVLKKRESKNFISQNAKQTHETKHVPEPKQETKNPNYGKVPQYIVDRKQQKEEEEEYLRRERQKKSECPPGMVLMAEEDRLETLKVLDESKKKVTQDLGTLPFICDTVTLKNKKTALENKLVEIEEAIKIFSRTKVFVAE